MNRIEDPLCNWRSIFYQNEKPKNLLLNCTKSQPSMKLITPPLLIWDWIYCLSKSQKKKKKQKRKMRKYLKKSRPQKPIL